MTPTVGRQVHFFTSPTGDPDDVVPNAATIVRVHSNDQVDLYVLDPDEPYPYYANAIYQGRKEGRWDWPPKV